MKLHFDKSWARQFDPNSDEPELIVGEKSNMDSVLALQGKNDLLANWKKFPLEEIIDRKWVGEKITDFIKDGERVLELFLDKVYANIPLVYPLSCAHWRRTTTEKVKKGRNEFSLLAWHLYVLHKADLIECKNIFNREYITDAFLKQLSAQSIHKDGPLRVKEILHDIGITLIIEPCLSQSHVDGASMLSRSMNPVIGMSLRYDRIDNFWFTLFHELIHVQRHLNVDNHIFIDDFDKGNIVDDLECVADRLAGEALIPRNIFRRSNAYRLKINKKAIRELADKLQIHPAIVAGRIRNDIDRYDILSDMIGQGEVCKLFEEFQN